MRIILLGICGVLAISDRCIGLGISLVHMQEDGLASHWGASSICHLVSDSKLRASRKIDLAESNADCVPSIRDTEERLKIFAMD